MDYTNDVIKILKSIRGDRDQNSMDRLFDLPRGSFHKFEAGSKIFKLNHLLQFSQVEPNTVPISRAFERILSVKSVGTNCFDLYNSFASVWGEPSRDFITEDLGFSDTKWWRLKNAKAEWELADFLALVDFKTGKLGSFINVFETNSRYEHSLSFCEDYESYVNLVEKNPDITLLTAAIELQSLRSESESLEAYVCRLSGLSSVRYRFLKRELIRIGVCREFSDHLELELSRLEFRDSEKEVGSTVHKFIIKEAMSLKFDETHRKSYFIRPASARSTKKIANLMSETYREMAKILEEDDDASKDQLLAFSQVLFSTGR